MAGTIIRCVCSTIIVWYFIYCKDNYLLIIYIVKQTLQTINTKGILTVTKILNLVYIGVIFINKPNYCIRLGTILYYLAQQLIVHDVKISSCP